MIIFFIALFIICCINLKFSKGSFVYDNLSKKNQNQTCVRGIFCVFILISHAMSYFSNISSFLDTSAHKVTITFAQLIVVMFFFYSGFGIMESYKANNNYFKSYPKNRILKTFMHFALAICLFIVLNLILDRDYSVKTTLLAFTGYTSIGNSNWFMFAMFMTYIATYVSYLMFKNKYALTTSTAILTLIYIYAMYKFQYSYWYDTILVFPFGMLYSLLKEKIEQFVLKSNKHYYITAIISLAVLTMLYFVSKKFNPFALTYNIFSIVFAFVILLITYKFQLGNRILLFLGKHSFSIYILQRLSMIVFKSTKLLDYHFLFALICFSITMLVAVGFDYVCDKIDSKLFAKKKPKLETQESKKEMA